MRTNKILLATIAALGALASPLAPADTQTCTSSGCATTAIGVTINVNIPGLLRLRLGPASGAPAVNWAAGTITAAVLGDGTNVNASSVTNSGGGTGNQLAYQVLSNLGGTSVSVAAASGGAITCTTAGTCGADTIPFTEIVATNTGNVAMPAVGSSTTVNYGGAVINESGFWQYEFNNTTIYRAGDYSGTINYTVTDD